MTALGQFTLGCVNALGDLISAIGDIITALLALIDNPEAFLGEQYTVIRDTVNAAVQDPDNFISEALAGILRLDLLQENPAEWVGTIGCELLIEILLTLTGAGAAAVAARLTERVLDFLQARRRGGDGGGGTPVTCVLRSFSADTEVLLANGDTIDIADVTVGDMVFAHDPETGTSGPRQVVATWPHTDTLLEFEVGGSTITTTEDHEFWNVTDQAWQETQHIDEGDLLLTADGETVEAGTLLSDTAHKAPAFDLTIDGIHAYHVTAGENPVLVHNTDGRCTDLGDDWTQAPPSEIPGSRECEACAAEIIERLDGGETFRLEVSSEFQTGNTKLPEYRGVQPDWDFHEVVLQEGRIYDAFGPRTGVPVDEWVQLWDGFDEGIINFGGLIGG